MGRLPPLPALSRVLIALGLVWFVSGCTTVLIPTRPDAPLSAGPRVGGVRFAGDRVQVREPGMPLSQSRSWDREVQNYTAKQLNLLLSTDDLAPDALTVVTFDLVTPPSIEIGQWKEMTIQLASQLPDGRWVRSPALSRYIDSTFEAVSLQGMGCTASVLDVAASVAAIAFIFAEPTDPLACGFFVGSLVGGLALNVGQSVAKVWVASSEQSRWSNLYAEALLQHAEDIRTSLRSAPPGNAASVAPPEAPRATGLDELPPPPALLDPAESGGGVPKAQAPHEPAPAAATPY